MIYLCTVKLSLLLGEDCSCGNPKCRLNLNTFYKYIEKHLLIDDGIPDCNFYYCHDMKPTHIESNNFTFV